VAAIHTSDSRHIEQMNPNSFGLATQIVNDKGRYGSKSRNRAGDFFLRQVFQVVA
jgi:hypothetical protein